jgi:hypothetical protein
LKTIAYLALKSLCDSLCQLPELIQALHAMVRISPFFGYFFHETRAVPVCPSRMAALSRHGGKGPVMNSRRQLLLFSLMKSGLTKHGHLLA